MTLRVLALVLAAWLPWQAASLSTRVNQKDQAELSRIPAGTFLMGSDASELQSIWKRLGWDPSELEFTKAEQPAHRVTLDSFWMYRTLVTVAQFRAFAAATGRSMPAPPSYGWADDHPMVKETWAEADAYCTWAGGQLPTEAQWEYAARGGRTGVDGTPRTVFAWGDDLPSSTRVANLADETFKRSGYYSANFHQFAGYDDGVVTASPVRAFPPNSYGIFDVAGNVLEWVADWYADDYYAHSPAANPRGPATGTRRVLRGGAFDTIPTITRLARRLGNDPTIRHDEKGFRCVQPSTPAR